MTEPPEPRRPEEGGGEDSPDAYRPDPNAPYDDEAPPGTSEWFDDDVLLDQIGSGEEPDEFDDRGELRDMLEAWRDEVDSEPVPPIAERAQEIHDFNEEVDRATRPPDNGGPVTATEDAAQLRALGTETYTSILGAIDVVAQALGQAAESFAGVPVAARNGYGAASGILGEGHANLNDINGATSALEELITPMQGEIESLRQQCNTLQQQAATIESTYAAAANAIGGGAG